jgi:uncharacterized Zn-finger protein
VDIAGRSAKPRRARIQHITDAKEVSPTAERGLGIGSPDRYGATRKQGDAETRRGVRMAEHVIPHFHNTPGVPVIEIGASEFMCVGEKPPFDHPHIFIDMGDASEAICPYCSTLFRHDPSLDPHAARPAECALMEPLTA